MQTDELSSTIATLVTNGFHIYKVERFFPKNDNVIINTNKFDRLGAEIRYSILFSKDTEETPLINSLLNSCKGYKSNPIYVNDHYSTNACSSYTTEKFFEFFGGIINSGLILVPNLPDILNELGHNKLSNGLTGEPDDLHELYVSECVQFLLTSPTRRYGKERLFQKLPDGVVLGKDFMLLIDSKAYANGFGFSADDIERFASYVNDFNYRYSYHFGRVYSFVVISGHFNDSKKSISSRSDELYKKCLCKLSCITSEQLGNIVQLLQNTPEYRSSIDWRNVFSEIIVEMKHIEKEIQRIQKDKVH